EYKEKEFRNVSAGDLGIETEEEKQELEKEATSYQPIFDKMSTLLQGKVQAVKASHRLRSHAVCFSADGEISIEMEKVLNQMPDGQSVKADKVLEINTNHDAFKGLENAFEQNDEKFELFTNLLYNQALLIEGLPLEDPVGFTNDISKIMK